MNLINSKKEFQDILTKLKFEKVIGVDTEFERKNTYHAKLCLIQISTPNYYFAVDPLAFDVKEFCEILESKEIIKIFHAPIQDIGIFYQMYNCITNNIFDTQEAAKHSKIKRQISYRELCSKVLNVEIKKEQGYREWSIRPLPEDMLEYALQDVKYLISLYHELKSRISKAGNQHIFKERMQEFSTPETFDEIIENSWKKLKTNENNPHILSRIIELSKIREEAAIKLDVPRKFIVTDEDLVLIAKKLPKDISSFYNLRFSKKIEQKHAEKFVNICCRLD